MLELSDYGAVSPDRRELYVDEKLAAGDRFFGFGHRFHTEGDPRAKALLEIAATEGFVGHYLTLAEELQDILRLRRGISMNIEAACAAILLDLGVDHRVAHLFILLGRGPMFAAAYLERLDEKAKPFPVIEVFDTE